MEEVKNEQEKKTERDTLVGTVLVITSVVVIVVLVVVVTVVRFFLN
jgi:hypothetical protein